MLNLQKQWRHEGLCYLHGEGAVTHLALCHSAKASDFHSWTVQTAQVINHFIGTVKMLVISPAEKISLDLPRAIWSCVRLCCLWRTAVTHTNPMIFGLICVACSSDFHHQHSFPVPGVFAPWILRDTINKNLQGGEIFKMNWHLGNMVWFDYASCWSDLVQIAQILKCTRWHS